jgi:hypothetical protein
MAHQSSRLIDHQQFVFFMKNFKKVLHNAQQVLDSSCDLPQVPAITTSGRGNALPQIK